MKTVHENIPEDNAEAERGYRDRIDLLRSRVGLLTGEDRMLMTMYIENGNSFRQMSRLSGVNEVRIARRIHKVTERLMNGGYITCLRSRDKFSKGELDIAKDYLLTGLSIKKIARRRATTYYCVRKTLKKIQGIIALPPMKTAVSA
jgi:transposase-like protein